MASHSYTSESLANCLNINQIIKAVSESTNESTYEKLQVLVSIQEQLKGVLSVITQTRRAVCEAKELEVNIK